MPYYLLVIFLTYGGSTPVKVSIYEDLESCKIASMAFTTTLNRQAVCIPVASRMDVIVGGKP